MSQPTRLKIQWSNLFPEDSFDIEGTDISIPVKPMPFARLASVLRELKGFSEAINSAGISFENITPTEMLDVASILVDKFPNVIAKAANIHPDDVDEMPLDVIVGLLTKIIEVNMKSKDSLLKNFKGLTALLPQVEMDQDQAQK